MALLDVANYAKEHGSLLRLVLRLESGRPARTASRHVAALARGLITAVNAVDDLVNSRDVYWRALEGGRCVTPPALLHMPHA